MDLAISNFAWDNKDHEFVFIELKNNGITKIETVLTKIKDWASLNDDDILNYKKELDSYGIGVCSMQSLFFNLPCKSLCEKDIIIPHVAKLIKYSQVLGVKVLVMGSPGLRVSYEGWRFDLVNVLKNIDDMLESTDIKLVIEPNSAIYNGKYFHTLGEIALFLDINDFRNIGTMIDTHNSLLENSDPIIELNHFFDYIEHIHVSEVKLKPLSDLTFHDKFSNEIKKSGYDKIITFELGMYDNFSESINTFSKIYQ
jgi:sugar phosphate isomerase/epimerase